MATVRIDLGLTAPIQLGRLLLNPALRVIRRDDGAEVVVEPRVMQVLLALAEARGEIVRRENLTERCWDGRIVGEDAINRVLSRLRRVAEGIGEGSFRIETITKVGYRLVELGEHAGTPPERVSLHRPSFPPDPLQHLPPPGSHRIWIFPAAALLTLAVVVGGWRLTRPNAATAHTMMVRLAGFQLLSVGLPPTMREAVNAEITAAFNADGVIGVSTASNAGPATAPAYALGGTIYRTGSALRVITRFTNERTGAILWSNSVDYPAGQAMQVPHKTAVGAGIVIRCGLFGASTYHAALPDAVLSNYLQYCQQYWSYGGSKTLRFAQLVVAAVPDFSWGWSAVGNGFMQAAWSESDPARVEEMRAAGRQAEDKALALDPNNSEALGHKAILIDRQDWVGQVALLKRAIAAKPLDCGCEHYGYGLKLEAVGLLGKAVEQYRSATDMLALWPDSQRALARLLVATGRIEESKPHFAAAINLSDNSDLDKRIAVEEGVETGDYAAAISALREPQPQLPEQERAALLSAYQALASADPHAKGRARQALLARSSDGQTDTMATVLAALGENHAALELASDSPWLFWRRSMRGVLNDPAFPAVADRLGLLRYWRTTRTKPDVCSVQNAPAFCRML